jgi:hypothetical protein
VPLRTTFNPFTGTLDYINVQDKIEVERTTAQIVSGHTLVVPTGSFTTEVADNATLDHHLRTVWMTTMAAGAGEQVQMLAFGAFVEPSWDWVPHMPIYLGSNGAMTQVPPSTPGALFVLQVAIATSPRGIFYNPKVSVVLA